MTALLEGRPRSSYSGAIQILRFNWPWYGLALAVCVAAGLCMSFARPASAVVALAILSAGGLAAFWSVASLGVSHLVYDRSKVADGRWIDEVLSSPPIAIANFHAGLDETSGRLSEKFPSARLAIFDFHDPDTMTERSIARARLADRSLPASIPIDFRKIPLGEGTEDAAFVVFAAHELRSSSDQVQFFREMRRVLRPDGELVVIEHLRDAWNLLAFGPGAFHFMPRGRWRRVFLDAGLEIQRTFRITPFVSVFRLRRVGPAPRRS